MEQLQTATGLAASDLGVEVVIVTRGSDGADLYVTGGPPMHFAALQVTPVDTTGAGDTFTGYVLAGLDKGFAIEGAIENAMRAAALMVTRHGTADVIPTLSEVEGFRP